jgi:hypothetical protein
MNKGTNAGKINRPNVVNVPASESNAGGQPKIWHEEVEDDSKPVLRDMQRSMKAETVVLQPPEIFH